MEDTKEFFGLDLIQFSIPLIIVSFFSILPLIIAIGSFKHSFLVFIIVLSFSATFIYDGIYLNIVRLKLAKQGGIWIKKSSFELEYLSGTEYLWEDVTKLELDERKESMNIYTESEVLQLTMNIDNFSKVLNMFIEKTAVSKRLFPQNFKCLIHGTIQLGLENLILDEVTSIRLEEIKNIELKQGEISRKSLSIVRYCPYFISITTKHGDEHVINCTKSNIELYRSIMYARK